MKEFLKGFKSYYKKVFISRKTGKPTGAAISYANAVKYLCEFLGITNMDLEAINKCWIEKIYLRI